MFFSEMLTLLAPCNFPLTFVSLQLQSSKIKTVPACALSFWSLDCWPLNKGADCMYLHSSLYQTEKGSHFCVIWGTEVYALFVFIYLVPHAGTFWWTHISCCRWTHSQEQKKMCSSKSWCLHIKLIKNLQDIVEAVEWIKDEAAGVNIDEKELFSDLRKDLLTGDNDTVISCEAEMLPVKSSLCCTIWTIHLLLENLPLVRWNLTS